MSEISIFFLNSCLEWGGGEKWTFETAKALHDKGYDITIGSAEESKLFKQAQSVGINTKKVSVKNSLSVMNPFKLYNFINYLKKKNITHLFLNLSQDLKFGGVAGKVAKVDNIIYRRGSAIPIKNRFYTKFFLGDCVTKIIANSKATKRTILKNTSDWLNERKINIIYNGIKINEVEKELKDKSNIREEFNIDDEITLIANIGRLTEQKGHKYLLKAVSYMRREIHNFKVLIVGTGELEKNLKEIVKQNKLKDYVIFTGFRNDIYNILSQVDFMLHTALWEGFGYVVAEAMAVGTPVVSTDVSNISELIEDGETGYLAKSKDPKDIAEKAIKMYKNKHKNQFGRKAQSIIKNNFSFKRMINEIEKIIKETGRNEKRKTKT